MDNQIVYIQMLIKMLLLNLGLLMLGISIVLEWLLWAHNYQEFHSQQAL
jgi:hypothetical protein